MQVIPNETTKLSYQEDVQDEFYPEFEKEPLIENKLFNDKNKLVFESENGKLVVVGKFVNNKFQDFIEKEDDEISKKSNYVFSKKLQIK